MNPFTITRTRYALALAHVDHLAAENARLRAGIEYLTRVGYSHTPDCDREREAGWLEWHPDCGRCWEGRLHDLLNPPTGGETDHE